MFHGKGNCICILAVNLLSAGFVFFFGQVWAFGCDCRSLGPRVGAQVDVSKKAVVFGRKNTYRIETMIARRIAPLVCSEYQCIFLVSTGFVMFRMICFCFGTLPRHARLRLKNLDFGTMSAANLNRFVTDFFHVTPSPTDTDRRDIVRFGAHMRTTHYTELHRLWTAKFFIGRQGRRVSSRVAIIS